MINRHLDDCLEILITMLASDIARIDSILRQQCGTLRMSGEELVAVVVEVSDDGRCESVICKSLHDFGDRRGGRIIVDGNPHHLASGARQMRHLCCGTCSVSGIGVGHGLHDNWVSGPDHHATDGDARR